MKKILLLTSLIFITMSCSKLEQNLSNSIEKTVSGTNVETTNSGITAENSINPITKIDEISYKELISSMKSEYVSDQQFETCMVSSTKNCLNQVVSSVAQKKNDYNICEDLSEKSLVDFCKQGVVINDAMKKLDIKVCDTLGDNKYNCYSQVGNSLAINNLDVKYCDMIIDNPNLSTGTGTMINTLTFDQKKNCKNSVYMSMATSKKDKSVCRKIEDEFMKKNCEMMSVN